jgi:RNA polymerase sigma-70 factor (ECF subfamily)
MPEPAEQIPAKATDGSSPGGHGHASFPTTQWSMIVRAGADSDVEARAALESLCRRYWHPLYAFVRRQGRSHHEAEDATQQFLAQLLAADALPRARPERGRFRTFLLTALRNHLTSEWRRASAAKRGSGSAPAEIGPRDNGDTPEPEPRDPTLTPEQAFDRSWAQSVIDRAVHDLRAEYVTSGRGLTFDAIAPLIWSSDREDDFPQRAAAIGMTVNSFRVALHRARRRLGERLRAQVAETVVEPAEIDAELRHLIAAISGTGSSRGA